MTQSTIEYESRDGVAIIRLNRPAKRNALTAEMCDQLQQAWERLRDGPDRVGVLCAAGETFCAGADLSAPPPHFWRAVPDIGLEVGKPIIAVVQGPVVGLAVTLLAFCDLCVATEDARLIYPEARVGVSKGLVTALSARIPHKVAMELMLLGGPLSAQRAHEAGLVNRVVPAAEALPTALGMARQLADSAPMVLRQLKDFTRQTLPRSPAETLYLATRVVDAVSDSDDAAEGLRAFQEKRSPQFKGH